MLRHDAPSERGPSDRDRARYYAAALRALRFVERRAPTTRRFGANADALWGAFHGRLETADRIDLLIRDADAQWPSAFGARAVFALATSAEEDAFGPECSPMKRPRPPARPKPSAPA